MTTFLPKDLQDGLRAAQIASRKKASRLRVRAGDDEYPVLSLRADGFSVELDTVPPLRGLVDDRRAEGERGGGRGRRTQPADTTTSTSTTPDGRKDRHRDGLP